MGTTDTDKNPWGGLVEANKIYGDTWFVNIYPSWAWAVSTIMLFVFPPLGAFLFAWMFVDGIHHKDDDVEMRI